MLLGLNEEVIANFTAYGGERFKWFWKQGYAAEPDGGQWRQRHGNAATHAAASSR
jgi:hypothetical protein